MKDETVNGRNDINYVLLVQIIMVLAMTAAIFLTNRFNPEIYEYIRSMYSASIADSITSEQIVDSAEKIKNNIVNTVSVNAAAKDEKITENGETVAASLDINDEITVPAHGKITSYFGGRTNPITGLYSEHTGIDIAADNKSDILAAYNGIVEETGTTEKAGNYVLLLHSDGSETLYCHCSEICVREESLVKAGDTIAKVGATGWATGPHLHFEVRIDGESVNPLDYLEEKDGAV